jgi:hypothetical protein
MLHVSILIYSKYYKTYSSQFGLKVLINIIYLSLPYIFSRVGVTIRRGLGWMIGFIDHFNTQHSELHIITELLLIYTRYSSPLHTLVSSVCYTLH